jgi:hypothetical protein
MEALARPPRAGPAIPAGLNDPDRSIGGPQFDAILLWGSPLIASLLVWAWADMASVLPHRAGAAAISLMSVAIGVLTFAHLIAVVPRAYLNVEVFSAHRRRLTVVPVLLLLLLFLSPTALVIAAVLAVFWDVHHSAMQIFGLARIYDMKAGNDAAALRRTDLFLNWLLYVGPIGAGASLLAHLHELGRLDATPVALLTGAEGVAGIYANAIRMISFAAWALVLLFALASYLGERHHGYRMPPHKAALLLSTGMTSIVAWTLSPPFIAFAIVNLFHAVQYFALVWLKEGKRIGAHLGRTHAPALILFLALCGGFGLAYHMAESFDVLLAPFIACSLLHFWYDSFVWSVRKKQV